MCIKFCNQSYNLGVVIRDKFGKTEKLNLKVNFSWKFVRG